MLGPQDAGVLDRVAMIATRCLFQDAFIDVQRHVDGRVAIGVNRNIPTRAMGIAHDRCQFLLGIIQGAARVLAKVIFVLKAGKPLV